MTYANTRTLIFFLWSDDLANKQKRTYYSTDTKRHIYTLLVERNGSGRRLKKGVLATVSRDCECPRAVVQRIWRQGKVGGSVNAVKCKRKMNSGRKKILFDAAIMEAIPPSERTTIEQLAHAMDMKKSTLHRR